MAEGEVENNDETLDQFVNIVNSHSSIPTHDNLDVLYTNCDCYSNKKEELLLNVETHRPHLICLVEVNPKSGEKLDDAFLHISGYRAPIHNLLDNGRGIAVYVREDVKATKCDLDIITRSKFNESVWIDLSAKTGTLHLGCIYRSPNTSENNSNELIRLVDQFANRNKSFVMMGDFNHSSINWNEDHTQRTNRIDRAFHEVIIDNLLIQHVLEPTRFRHGQRPTLADLIISSEEDLVRNIRYLPPLGKSDHVCILLSVSCSTKRLDIRAPKRQLYSKGNYAGLRDSLSNVNWYEELSEQSTEEAWSRFHLILQQGIEKNVPSTARSYKRKKAPYLDKTAMLRVKEKNRAWRTYVNVKTDEAHENFKRVRNDLRKLTRDQKTVFEDRIATESSENPKAFWSYARSKASGKDSTPKLVDNNGNVATKDEDKAELLNKHFASVFIDEPNTNYPVLEPPAVRMLDITITKAKIERNLLKLDSSKSAGPDGIHAKILKETASEIAYPLEIIFNKSLKDGKLPDAWKTAYVTAIYKNKGKDTDPSNYRPISLTSICCKILEGFIRESMLTFLQATNQVSKEQHGFLPGKSCNTNLIETFDFVTSRMEAREPVDIVYIDCFGSFPEHF